MGYCAERSRAQGRSVDDSMARSSEHGADGLVELEELWRRLSDRLNELSAEAGESRGRAGTWSVRDVWAHIARWDDHSRAAIEAHRAGTGGAPEGQDTDYRTLNARWLAEDADLSAADAETRFRESFGAYRSLLGSLSAEEWDDVVRDELRSTLEHYRDHLAAPLEFAVAPGG